MRIFLNISPSKMANSFVQQFLLQQEPVLVENRVLVVKNQLRDGHPHFWLKKMVFDAVRSGRVDVAAARRASVDFFSFADPNRFDVVYHLLSGVLFGDPMDCTAEGVARGLETLRILSRGHDVHLFTSIRRQDKFLESFYMQKIQRGMSLSFEEYMAEVDVDQLSWDRLIRSAEEVFGRDHVHVLPFEALYAGEISFLRALVSVFGDPDVLDYADLEGLIRNRSYSEIALTIARTANPLLNEGERPTLRAFLQHHFSNVTHPRPVLLGEERSREVLTRHRQGNEAVFARYCPEADLAAMGYLPS